MLNAWLVPSARSLLQNTIQTQTLKGKEDTLALVVVIKTDWRRSKMNRPLLFNIGWNCPPYKEESKVKNEIKHFKTFLEKDTRETHIEIDGVLEYLEDSGYLTEEGKKFKHSFWIYVYQDENLS